VSVVRRITRATLFALLEIHQGSKNLALHRGEGRNNFHHQRRLGNTSHQASTTGRRVPSHQNSDRECRTVEGVHRSETPHNTALQFRSWFFTQPNQRTFRRCCQLVSASGANSAPLGISRAANRMQSPIHSIHSKFWRPGSGRSAAYEKLPIAGHHGLAD
jgi:hypothetical protein